MKALKSMAVAAMVLFATAAIAAAPAKPTVIPAKSGAVTYNHGGKHATLKCTQCHADDKGGKIAGLDKDKGHAMCHECHKKEGKGPQKCAECHKK